MSKRFAPISPIGVGGTAPSADEPLPGPQEAVESPSDATTPRDRDASHTVPEDHPEAAPAAKARVRRPAVRRAPSVESAVAMTVRVDPDEAAGIDRYVLDLRAETGQRLDKAEVIRELLRLAQHNPAVHRALVKRLS